jgi:UDP-2-acetamido-3-amino-2,3-dideoxy-glucuronate N-acetyltransferase
VTVQIKIAVIGCGHWGRNLLRNFYHLEHLAAVCDLDIESLSKLKKSYPGVLFTQDYDDLLNNPDINAIVISTPSQTHYALAKKALEANKHVYVEKPIATSYQDTLELNELAEKHDRILMVGHLLLYHPHVNRLKQLIAEDYLGEIRYIESDRLNLNPHRSDRSVFWDLAPHDLSMMMYLLNDIPSHVISVQGTQTGEDGLVDAVHIELEFNSGVRGHIHNSWVHPVKHVKLVVRGNEKSAVIDDTLSGAEKLQIFDYNKQPEKTLPEALLLEPLKLECQHFINCIKSNRQPKSDGQNGLHVVRILEEAENKLKLSGIMAKLPSPS